MQPSSPRTAKVVLAALVTCGVGAAPVQADTIPFTSAFTGTSIASDFSQTQVKDQHSYDGDTALSPSTASQRIAGDWGSAEASARADMASGELGGRATVARSNTASHWVYSQFQGSIGDGFRSFDENNAPFTWDGKTASFTLDIDGSIFAPDHMNNMGAAVALILYEPGSVNPDINLFGDSGRIAHYLYYLGRANQRTTYSLDGSTAPEDQIEVFPTAFYGDPSSGVHIEQTINPGRDFDWVLMMRGSGYLFSQGEIDVDLSHTVTFGYTGPAGATTQSVSGVFNNIRNQPASVPEPTTFALLGWGVCALVARRRLTKS